MNEYYTIKEVAEIFKAGPETIRIWFRKGKIKGTKTGRRILIPKKEVERMMKVYLINQEIPLENKNEGWYYKAPKGKVLAVSICCVCNKILGSELIDKNPDGTNPKLDKKWCENCKEK